MINLIRYLLLSLCLAGRTVAGAEPFSQAVFDRLQQEGVPTLVSIHADWCPTCRAQAPVVSKLLDRDDYRRIQLLRVDFDRQKDVVKTLKATMQSTLIVFKNGREVGRSVGDTREASIEALFKKAL